MKGSYKCSYCEEENPDKFTKRVVTICRKCRAAKSKDSLFLEFKDAVNNQNLVNKHWIVA